MKNSFDDKIKEALENFEMPYDANAWAEFEQQLPSTPAAGNSGGGTFSTWKIAALVAVAAVATSVWYFSKDDAESVPETEQVASETSHAVVNEEHATEINIENKVGVVEKADNEIAEANTTEARGTTTQTEKMTDVDEEIFRSTGNEGPSETVDTKEVSKVEVPSPIKVTPTASNESPIMVNFIASTVTACVDQDVSFINESVGSSAQMVWDFGDGNTSTEKDPIHSFVASGNYTVTLRAEGKTDVIEKTVDIRVNPVPTPAFSAERKLNGYQAIPLYVFSTATQPNEQAMWSFSDGSKVSGTEALQLFRESGKNTAKLTVTNKFGCSTSIDQEFTVEKFNLLAPSAFTPNGDGNNEVFIPEALPEMGVAFEMTIQNPRTGDIVYRTENASAPWNGKLNNSGQKLETGTYVWTVVIKDPVLKNRVFNDKVHLQR